MDTNLQKLLFSTAKRDWSPQRLSTIKTALTKNIDWPTWLAMARYYNLSQLLYFNLRRQDLLGQLPATIQQELKQDYLQTNSINLAYYNELNQVLAQFQDNNIQCLVLKGAALTPSIYKDLGVRSFADIDLLIQREDLEKAQNVLSERYQPQTPFSSALHRRCYFHLAYQRKAAPHLSLELHWAFFSPTTPMELDLTPFWQEPQTLAIADCQFLSPRREYLFLHQCLHFSGHYFMSWKDVADIDWFLSSEETSLDWDIILKLVKRYDLENRIYYPLLWAGQLLQADLPLDVLSSLEPTLSKQQLFQQMLRREGEILTEPVGRNKDLRAVIDLFLLAPYQVMGFFRRLCWPGIAWLTIFPDKPAPVWPLSTMLVLLRGVRLVFYVCWYLIRV